MGGRTRPRYHRAASESMPRDCSARTSVRAGTSTPVTVYPAGSMTRGTPGTVWPGSMSCRSPRGISDRETPSSFSYPPPTFTGQRAPQERLDGGSVELPGLADGQLGQVERAACRVAGRATREAASDQA